MAHGLGAAWLLESIAVSLPTSAEWATNEILLESTYLDPETFDLIPNPAAIHHASTVDHFEAANTWLQIRLQQTIQNTDALWKERVKRFPHLDFCASTETQIKALQGDSLAQIVKKLYELEFYCREWKTGNFDKTQIKHCTPESESTLNNYPGEHIFRCPDGTDKLFQWHVRYTSTSIPSGRIFFYPVVAQQRLIVGHIGGKLATTKSGRM